MRVLSLLLAILLISSMVFCEEEIKEPVNQEAEYRSEFEEYDTNKDGFITVQEIMQVVGEEADKKEIEEFMQQVDSDKDGQVSFDEYVEAVKKWEAEQPQMENDIEGGANQDEQVDLPVEEAEDIQQTA